MCSVCLETLKDPATLPCGHSYCLACIKNHWDKRDSKGQYSCPQCRQVFNPRPSLAKSTVLVEAMEKLRANSLKQPTSSSVPVYLEVLPNIMQRPGSIYPQLPRVDPRTCPKHNKPQDLFCQEDKECVCEVCCQHEHEGHCVVKPENERKQRQVGNFGLMSTPCVYDTQMNKEVHVCCCFLVKLIYDLYVCVERA